MQDHQVTVGNWETRWGNVRLFLDTNSAFQVEVGTTRVSREILSNLPTLSQVQECHRFPESHCPHVTGDWEEGQIRSITFLRQVTSQIYVKTLTGMTLTVKANARDTVSDLTNRIQDLEGISPSDQRLIYKGERITDTGWKNGREIVFYDKSLTYHGIGNESTLHLVIKMRGGAGPEFDFNRLEERVETDFDQDAPRYRVVTRGLNLKGRCTTVGCEARNQVIWIQKGMGQFRIGEERFNSQCPSCNQIADQVENLGFWDCIYGIEGMRTRPHQERVNQEHEAGTERFTTFREGDAGSWAYLNITTQPRQ